MLAGFKDMSAKGKSAIQAEISLKIKLNNKIKFWGVEAYRKLGFGLAGSVGLGIQDNFGVDNSGLYIQKDLIFEGIKLKFEAEANAGIRNGKDEDDDEDETLFDIGGKIDGEITLLAHTFSTDKIYLT